MKTLKSVFLRNSHVPWWQGMEPGNMVHARGTGRRAVRNGTYYYRLSEVFVHCCTLETGQVDPVEAFLVPIMGRAKNHSIVCPLIESLSLYCCEKLQGCFLGPTANSGTWEGYLGYIEWEAVHLAFMSEMERLRHLLGI